MTLGDLKSLAIAIVLMVGFLIVVPGLVVALLRMFRACAGRLPKIDSLRSFAVPAVLGWIIGVALVVFFLWKADRLVTTVLFFAVVLASAGLLGTLLILGVAKLLERLLRPKDAICGDMLVALCPFATALLFALTDAEKDFRNVALF